MVSRNNNEICLDKVFNSISHGVQEDPISHGGVGAEVNKVAKPTNLVGRKLCGSLGLTENISWKSGIILMVWMLISQN